MLELFFALVAANKKGWRWYVAFPLALDIFCVVSFFIFSQTEISGLYILGYFLALTVLALMAVIPKSKIFPKQPSKRR